MKRALFACLITLACQTAPPTAQHAAETTPSVVQLTPAGMENAQVQTAAINLGTFSPQLVVQATITADPQDIAHVGAHLAGRVVGIRVRLGDQVKKNQGLVEIDTVEIHHVSTDYLTSVARARQANDELARQQRLVEERVGAQQDLKRAEATADAANAALREAEEHLHFLGLSDEDITRMQKGDAHNPVHSVVRAPLAGRVEAVNVALGQVLTGTEDLITIIQSDRVWATLRVYERDLPSVTPGAAVTINVVSYPQHPFHGKVTSISDLVDTATRTVEVRADLTNGDGLLKPGMSAVGSVALQTAAQSQLWIPAGAVQVHDGAKIVFVKTGERQFTPRPVVLGLEQGGFVPLLSGITPGTEIAVNGALAMRGELERSEMQGD